MIILMGSEGGCGAVVREGRGRSLQPAPVAKMTELYTLSVSWPAGYTHCDLAMKRDSMCWS